MPVTAPEPVPAPSIFVATPCFGGLVTTGYMMSVLKLMQYASRNGFEINLNLLGRDSLVPLVEAARARSGGLLVLTRTSNPGAADLQDRRLESGEAVSDAIAAMVEELGRPAMGRSGLTDVGAVTGATAPEHLERLRAKMPGAVMLLPGGGAQGASGRGLAPAFAPGPAGGLIAASRAIVYAYESTGGKPADGARDEARRLRELIWDLYS